MQTNDDSVRLFKINPKVLEILNQRLKTMKQLSMAPLNEESIQVPDILLGP